MISAVLAFPVGVSVTCEVGWKVLTEPILKVFIRFSKTNAPKINIAAITKIGFLILSFYHLKNLTFFTIVKIVTLDKLVFFLHNENNSMKITVYTTTDCQFSKQEKEYLTSHNLPFDEKNLETNREYLTEMLTVGNNFAGTPVTKIEKDDSTIIVLKGFTQDEFDKELGLAKPAPAVQPQSVQQPPQNTPTTPQPQTPIPEPTPPAPPMPNPEPVPPTIPQPPVQPTNPSPTPQTPANDPQLNALLNDLQSKAGAASSTPASPSNLPNIPNPNF